jgi:hypothetical protein
MSVHIKIRSNLRGSCIGCQALMMIRNKVFLPIYNIFILEVPSLCIAHHYKRVKWGSL